MIACMLRCASKLWLLLIHVLFIYIALYLAYIQELFMVRKAAVSACACNIQYIMRNGGKLSLKAGQNVLITIN